MALPVRSVIKSPRPVSDARRASRLVSKSAAEEKIFGPHANPFSMPMLHHTGYEPVESRHVLDSALCGTCHTVITPTLDRAGNPAGEFVEQAPYLEWLAGSYSDEGRTCQSCHMPLLRNGKGQLEASYIAHRPPGGPFPPTSPRTPFGRHSFSGGNVRGPGDAG